MLGIGQIIKGLDIGMANMCPGEKRKITVPPTLAFGENGKGESGSERIVEPANHQLMASQRPLSDSWGTGQEKSDAGSKDVQPCGRLFKRNESSRSDRQSVILVSAGR